MAVKRAQYLPRSEQDEYEVDDIGLEREVSEEEQELFTLIDDFNSQDPKAQIRVYEAKEAGPNTRGQLPLAYLFTFSPGQLTSQLLMDRVNETYGPGSYEAHIYAPHPQHDNRLKLARKIKFEIGQTRDEKEESLPFAARRYRAKSSGNESPSEIMRTFAEMMAAQNERTEALMREILHRQAGPISDPIQAMAQMMGIMVQFQQMMPQNKPASIVDEIQKLAMIKEVFADMGGGGDNSESGVWLKMLDKFGTPLVNALGQPQPASIPGAPMMQIPYNPQPQAQMQPPVMNPQMRNPNQAMPMPPPQNPQLNAPQPQQQSQANNLKPSKEDEEMRENVNRLVGMAKMGLAPEMLAGVILDHTPEEGEEKLYAFISDSRCIEKMAALNPEVNQHTEFFEQLRVAILSAFTEETDEEQQDLQGDTGGATLPETGSDTSQENAAGETGK